MSGRAPGSKLAVSRSTTNERRGPSNDRAESEHARPSDRRTHPAPGGISHLAGPDAARADNSGVEHHRPARAPGPYRELGRRRSSSGEVTDPYAAALRRCPHSPPTPGSGRRGCRVCAAGRERVLRRRVRRAGVQRRGGRAGPGRQLRRPASSTSRSSTAYVEHGGPAVDRRRHAAALYQPSKMLTPRQMRGPSPHAIRAPGRPCNAGHRHGRRGRGSSNRSLKGRAGRNPAGRCRDGPAGPLLLTLTRRLALADREATGISVDDSDLVQQWLDNTPMSPTDRHRGMSRHERGHRPANVGNDHHNETDEEMAQWVSCTST